MDETGQDEFDDDADVQEDDNDYLELLAQEATRLRAKVNNLDEGGTLDDDEEDDEFDDDDMVYESPLEGVPVFEPFRTVMQQMRMQHADLFERMTAQLSVEQQQSLQQVLQLPDSDDNGTSQSA